MAKKFGFDLCQNQVVDRVASRVNMNAASFEHTDWYGDTPIEKLFHFALYMSLTFCEQEYFTGLISVPEGSLENAKRYSAAKSCILMERQVQLEGWRVDFMISVYADWAREPGGGTEGWKQLIVECDGHDFHERTKEQAARDRERDRRFQLSGIEVFRFTGSELWKDPLGCADQVIKWGNRRV